MVFSKAKQINLESVVAGHLVVNLDLYRDMVDSTKRQLHSKQKAELNDGHSA